PGGKLVEGCGRLFDVKTDGRAASVRGRVGDRHRAGQPAQAVILELEVANVRRGGSERIESAEQVVDVSGLDELTRAHCATGQVRLLEYGHLPAGVGEEIRGHEPVRTRSDDNGVTHRPIPPGAPGCPQRVLSAGAATR